MDDRMRLFSKINIRDSNECWPWKASLSKGYANFWYKSRMRKGHIIVYEMTKGKIKEGNVIRHKCHNKKCCNPNHLVQGTVKQNCEDSKKAGHYKCNKKISVFTVKMIRLMCKYMSRSECARRMGFNVSTISRCCNRGNHDDVE